MNIDAQLHMLSKLDRKIRACPAFEYERFMRIIFLKRGIGCAIMIATGQVAQWTPTGYQLRHRFPGREFVKVYQRGEKTMRLKVKTVVDLTPTQRDELQHFGCDATPFIIWPSVLVFAATCTSDQEQKLRNLAYVTEVEAMPTYSIA